MSTSIEEPPEKRSEKIADFFKNLEEEYKPEIIAFIREIESGSLGKETQLMLQGKGMVDKGKEGIVSDLQGAFYEGLNKNIITTKHIVNFLRKILNANPNNFFEIMALFKNMFRSLLTKKSVDKKEREELIICLTEVCDKFFYEALQLDSTHSLQEAGDHFLQLGIPVEIIRNAYQLKTEESQKKILRILLNAAGRSDAPQADLIFNLKMANPNGFEKYLELISVEERDKLNEALKVYDPEIIELIKQENFKEAADIFSHHPNAPLQLFNDLESDPNKLSEKQIIDFYNALLKVNYHKTINNAFLLLRVCLENPKLILKNPNLPIILISSYLQYAFQSGQSEMAISLLSSKPSWNKYISIAVHNLPEEARSVVLERLNPEKHYFPEELNLFEENEIKNFKILLNDLLINSPKNFEKFPIFKISDLIYGALDKYHNLAKLLISIYLEQGLESNRITEVCNVLCVRPLMVMHVLEAYKLLPDKHQKIVFDEFLKIGGSKYNAALIGGLQDINPSLFDDALKRLEEKDIELYNRIHDLLLVPKTERLVVSDIMEQFSLPFRDMTEYAARLFCAVIKKKKSYAFQPTVLADSKFREYLQHLKLAKPPIREKFILDSEHWLSGEVEIPEHGTPKIILMDSLGSDETKTHRIIEQQCAGVFDTIEIYLSANRRQDSRLGCTVYALRDVQELYTIGKYLSPKYHGSMVEYATQHRQESVKTKKELKAEKGVMVFNFDLPLRFMRTDQDPQRLETLISFRSLEERSAIINKPKKGERQGETALSSARKHFKKHTNKEGIQKEKNLFLTDKLNDMAKDVFKFLADHQFKIWTLETEMEFFTLENFKQKTNITKTTDEQSSKALYFSHVKHLNTQIAAEPTTTLTTYEASEFGNQLEKAYRALIDVLQLKIMTRIVNNLNSFIEDLAKLYANKEIFSIETLKAHLKKNLSDHEQKYLDDIDDGIYTEMLDNLAILAKSKLIQEKMQKPDSFKP